MFIFISLGKWSKLTCAYVSLGVRTINQIPSNRDPFICDVIILHQGTGCFCDAGANSFWTTGWGVVSDPDVVMVKWWWWWNGESINLCVIYLGQTPLCTIFFGPKQWPHSHNFCNRLQVELFHLIWWGHLRCRFWDWNVWTSGCSLNGILRGLQRYSEETYKDREDHSSNT